MDIPVTFTTGSFAFLGGGPEDLKDAIVAGLRATIPSDNLLLGQIGGTQPALGSGVVLWFNNGSWYYHVGGGVYQPVLIKVGTGTFTVTLAQPGTPYAANRTQTLQDKTGIIALTSDVYNPRPTITLSAATTMVADWSASFSFYHQLVITGTLIQLANGLPGQEIKIVVYNATSSAFTLTFPTYVSVIGGTAMPFTPTHPGTDMYIIRNVAGQYLLEQKQAFS